MARPPAGEPVLPLIDVVFFLLVFFMLVGRMEATAPFQVTPPVGRTGADMPAGGIVVSVGPAGDLAVDGIVLEAAEALDMIARLRADGPDRPVRINADAGTGLRHVFRLIAGAEARGIGDISLVVTPALP